MDLLVPVVLFLINFVFNVSHHFQALTEELEYNKLLPPRYDWKGNKFPQSFSQLVR